ncbi:MAG: cell wall anchor protein [Chloroflexota bacterium]
MGFSPAHPSVSHRPLTRRAVLAGAALAVALLPLSQPGRASAWATLTAASGWLRSQQLPEGGFTGFSGEADPSFTALAIVALAAAAAADPANAAAITRAAGWLEGQAADYAAQGPGAAAIAAAAAVAAGRDPVSFGGADLVAGMSVPLPEGAEPAAPGLLGNDVNDHAEIMLGLAAAGRPVDPALVAALEGARSEDGGWSYDAQPGAGVMDSNTTALVIQACAAAGEPGRALLPGAVRALARFLVPGKGYAYQLTEPLVADANSTALVIQALIAAGEDPASAAWGDAPAALAGFANPDGSFTFMAGDPEPSLYAALQAIPALAGKPLPVARLCASGEEAASGCVAAATGA